MPKKIKYTNIIILSLLLFLNMAITCHGMSTQGEVYRNPDTGYRIMIEDEAKLLTEEECMKLAKDMEGITLYGNAVFKTISANAESTGSYAEAYYHTTFGKNSGVLFLIDMDNRNIWIFSDGTVYKTVTKSYANTITDNVYLYARNGDYYECARNAFEQVETLMEGQKIAQPMKYISNFLLAAVLALLINFGVMISATKAQRAREEELLSTVRKKFACTKPTENILSKTKVYSPQSSDSGGSSGGSSGGGGGGGGSSSGGGGGHSF